MTYLWIFTQTLHIVFKVFYLSMKCFWMDFGPSIYSILQCEYCHNTCKFWSNFYISLSLCCGRSLLWNWLLKLIFIENLFKIASELTSIVSLTQILHKQVTTFFKYWVNTCECYHTTYEYCHNTCEYWAGEYTLNASFNK